MTDSPSLYSIDELAERAGVNRRTVRFYVQRGLLDAPRGLGRGRHYGAAHLNTLLRIRTLQEAGMALTDIAAALAPGDARSLTDAQAATEQRPNSTVWTHVDLADGVILQLRERKLTNDQVEALRTALAAVLKDTR